MDYETSTRRFILRLFMSIGFATFMYGVMSFVSGLTNTVFPNSTTYSVLVLFGFYMSKGWLIHGK